MLRIAPREASSADESRREKKVEVTCWPKPAQSRLVSKIKIGFEVPPQILDVEEKRAGVGFFDGADQAPTLQDLRNPIRRFNVAREPVRQNSRNLVPPNFELEEDLFLRRSSKRSPAGGTLRHEQRAFGATVGVHPRCTFVVLLW